jgi:hypothetical protein
MPEVAVEQLQFRPVAQMRGDFAAHRDQRAGAAGRHVHAPQQLLPRWIGGLRQRGRGFRRGVAITVTVHLTHQELYAHSIGAETIRADERYRPRGEMDQVRGTALSLPVGLRQINPTGNLPLHRTPKSVV